MRIEKFYGEKANGDTRSKSECKSECDAEKMSMVGDEYVFIIEVQNFNFL